jgi:hypothetical protein
MSSHEEPMVIQFSNIHQVVNLLSLIHVKRATLVVENSAKEKAIRVYGVFPTKGCAVIALRDMPQRNYIFVNRNNAIFDVIMMLAANLHLSAQSLRVINASGYSYIGKLLK